MLEASDSVRANSSIAVRAGSSRIPALDGLRGLAMLMVFAGHVAVFGTPVEARATPIVSFIGANRGLGVDLFFVLSGFLITRLLLDARGTRFFFRRFYLRRTLRIFPVYYAALATVSIAAVLFPGVNALNSISAPAYLANWTYTANFLIAARGWNVEPLFLLPFWSLALEEQFYIGWPLLVHKLRIPTLAKLSAVLIISAFCVRILLVMLGNSVGAYVLLPARADGLLVGAFIAMAPLTFQRKPAWIYSKYFFLAAWLIFVLDLAFGEGEFNSADGALRYSLHFTIAALAFGALLLLVVERRYYRWIADLLSTAPVRLLGKYSYAVYVFHVAVITALPGGLRWLNGKFDLDLAPGIVSFGLLAFAISLGLAMISWHVIEKPALAVRDIWSVTGTWPVENHPSAAGRSQMWTKTS